MKLTKILLVVIAILLVILLAFVPFAKNEPETAGPLTFAGNISEEEKEVWLEDYLSGLKLLESGDYDTAIEVFDNCIAIDPNNPSAYTARGDAYNAIGDYENATWNFQAASFLHDGNPIAEFEFAQVQEETTPIIVTQPEETVTVVTCKTTEDSGWRDDNVRLAKAVRYNDGDVLGVFTFHYDEGNRITGYTEDDYWDGDGKLSYTDVWEYTYDDTGKLLKEFNPSHSNLTTYEYTYSDGVLTRCLLSLEGLGYRTYNIETSEEGYVTNVTGKGVYDANYGFERSITYDKNWIPIRASGSETLSHGTSKKSYSYQYHPALMQITDHQGSIDLRIDDFQIASLPEFFVPDDGSVEFDENGYISSVLDKEDALVWEFSYEPKSEERSDLETEQNRRIARINEYNSKGVTETNTFDYSRDGLLAGYTTTYYENGKIVDKDVWTFEYTDDGRVFDERRDWGESDYHGYTHILDPDISGHQVFYDRGIQQQFYYEHDADGRITGMTGEGIHDLFYESDIEYERDKSGRVIGCSGTVSSAENAAYQISKKYDYSYSGVVLVEDSSTLNGAPLPVSYYLRVDMPEHIGLPEVVYYADDEIITDDDGYIVKILDKTGALRCELIFDYC